MGPIKQNQTALCFLKFAGGGTAAKLLSTISGLLILSVSDSVPICDHYHLTVSLQVTPYPPSFPTGGVTCCRRHHVIVNLFPVCAPPEISVPWCDNDRLQRLAMSFIYSSLPHLRVAAA